MKGFPVYHLLRKNVEIDEISSTLGKATSCVAVVALARKLAEILCALWLDITIFTARTGMSDEVCASAAAT